MAAFGAALALSEEVQRRLRRRLEQRLGAPLAELDTRTVAPEMRAPLLVVHDEGDRKVLFADGQALAAAWPGTRLHATRDLGHRRLLRGPGVVDAVVRFVAGAVARPRLMDPLEAELFCPELRLVA